MSARTATMTRTTGETDVSLTLALDGTGAGTRATGVGFFDHMLDLLARHGRLDLDVAAAATCRRAPTTRSRTSASCSGGRSTSRARRPPRDHPLRARGRADGRGARRVRDRRLGPAAVRAGGLRALPAGEIGGFELELAEEFFRAVASERAAHAPRRAAGGRERAPHDRGVLQGVRPRPARGGRRRPDGDRRPVHQGNAHVTLIAIVDFGMGNRRSVEKALEHVGARVRLTADHDVLRAADGLVLPGVGAFPEAMRNLAARRARRGRRASGRAPACRCSASASACSCCSRPRPSTRAPRAWGCSGARSTRCGRARGASCRTSAGTEVAFARPSVLTAGLGERAAFYHVHSFACRPADGADVVGWADYGERVRVARRARRHLRRRSSTPRSPRATGSRCWRQLHARVRPAGDPRRGVILFPAIDILEGRAVRLVEGRLRPLDGLRRRPAGGRARRGSPRARASCTWSTSTAPARVSRGRSSSSSGSRAGPACPSSTAAGCAASRPSTRRSRAGAERIVLGTAAFKDLDLLDEAVGRLRAACARGGRRARRPHRHRGLDAHDELPAEEAIRRLGERGVRRSSTRASTATAGWPRARTSTRCARGRDAVRGRFIYSGGIGSLDAPACARRAAAGQPRGRDRRQGAVRAPLHGRRGPGRTGSVNYKRVIPCMDVDAGRVVKGTHFVDMRDAGDPVELAERYDAEGADELVFLDITATHEKRDTMVELARRAADDVFVPFTIGGGVREVADAQAVLGRGRGQGVGQLGGRRAAGACSTSSRACSAPSAWCSRSTRSGPATAGRSTWPAAARRPAATRSTGPARASRAARGRSCSPAWTATARRTATTWRCSGRSRRRSTCR